MLSPAHKEGGGQGRLLYLDGLRGLALLMVLFEHFVTPYVLNAGRLGVELFFVLSGRLMAEILFVDNALLPSFFLRRFARIYPALFVFATAIFLMVHTFPQMTATDYLMAITLMQNYGTIFVDRVGVIDHLWSLCIEMHIYVLLGLMAALHRRWALPALPMLAGIMLLFMANGVWQSWGLGLDYYHVYWRTDVRGASILCGAVAYLMLRHSRATWLRASSWLPLVAFLIALAFSVNRVPDPLKYTLGTGCAALALVLLPYAPAAVLRLLENRVLVFAGVTSYSLYLWQQPFYVSGHKHLLLPLALLIGLASYRLVEQPARRTLNRLSRPEPISHT